MAYQLITALFFAVSNPGLGLHESSDFREALDKAISGRGFNGTVLLSVNGEVVLNEHIGYVDGAKKVKVTGQSVFCPGSVSKEFTTLSMMQLHQQNRLSYDEKISKYIDGLPTWADRITIEHVLTHTSGLPKVQWKKDIDTEDVLAQLRSSELAFEPGSGYLYTNLNVVVRALIVEKMTSLSYGKWLDKTIFGVAGMNGAYHQVSEQDIGEYQVPGDYRTFISGVTIYMTPMDLMKFEVALWDGSLIPKGQLLKALPGDQLSGKKNRCFFDFGSYSFNADGQLAFWQHDGSNPSHHALKYHNFENKMILIVMSSDGDKSTLFKIKEALLAQVGHEGE